MNIYRFNHEVSVIMAKSIFLTVHVLRVSSPVGDGPLKHRLVLILFFPQKDLQNLLGIFHQQIVITVMVFLNHKYCRCMNAV